ncbi:MAG: hypothetical protein HFI51_05050 [Lachnospiraceae bacterium]|jgi:RNA polymerase primary sigma factor|nr:hypothetical protein [Lachnospiraceae bacterium]
MTQEILFAQKLEQLAQTAKEQENCVSEEQLREAFAELSLGEEQLEMVRAYLRQRSIGIGEPAALEDYLSEQEIDYLDDYVKQLAELPQFSEGEKEAVTLSAMAGDADAQNRLIQIFLPQVVEISRLYAGQGVFVEDLIGEGNVALTMGVTMLGASRHAAEAQGMLGRMIMDAMEEFIAENAEETKKSRKMAERINKVADKANELAEELHRKVTIEELMNETGMSRKAIADAVRMSGNKIDAILAE